MDIRAIATYPHGMGFQRRRIPRKESLLEVLLHVYQDDLDQETSIVRMRLTLCVLGAFTFKDLERATHVG